MNEVELELLEKLMHAEHELGRWKKHGEDLNKQNKELQELFDDALCSLREIREICEATLIQIVRQEGGISYPIPNVHEVIEHYVLYARADGNGIMTMRAEPRKEAEDAEE